MGQKVLIIGGVAGGASAAARLRRLDEHAEIIMLERGGHISFANCGLPYYIGESIRDRSRLLVQTPEAMRQRFGIDVRINSEAIAVDPLNKKVLIRSKDRGEYEESFDALVLSPGAQPLRPGIPGIEQDNLFTLRNIPDTDRIKAHVDHSETRSAIVIGAGYVGVEMAENLRERGLAVTLVEAAPHILAPFDEEMAAIAEKELEDREIRLLLGSGVTEFSKHGSQLTVLLQNGVSLSADIGILAIGVRPDTDFLRDSGIELGPKGHIRVNERMETNWPGIYAVGDAVEAKDLISGQAAAIPLAGPANKQGRVAADQIAGLSSVYKGTQGTAILKIFQLVGASTGLNERSLKKLGSPYHAIYVHPDSHASYYPGAMPITLKLLFAPDGKVLGAQAFGYDGVDKRMDVIATVIRLGGQVSDLAELELAYAPPFSSAKDPVNMAGYVAENVLAGRMKVYGLNDLATRNPDTTMLVDVRTLLEYEGGHIQGALHMSVNDLRERMAELDPQKEIWVYCQVGMRGYIASSLLQQHGFHVRNLTGGYKLVQQAKFRPSLALPAGAEQESFQEAAQQIATAGLAAEERVHQTLDACGLCCPGPLIQIKQSMDTLEEGQLLRIHATDPGFFEDIQAWCKRTGNSLLELQKQDGVITALVRKGGEAHAASDDAGTVQSSAVSVKDNKTLVVFSGDLDKAIASFIIANGAASMGKKVTMFFTFWGLNILRRPEHISLPKSLMDRMFGWMMPRGSRRLGLSRMNMLGAGSPMIRSIMKKKNVLSLEELIQAALQQGVQLVACQMSMDVMGIRTEELIDGVRIGGVGVYLGEAEDSNVNLFI